ncbi:pathogen-associated molecular patterns-induced protein A70 [Ricinus communis]|uniref:DUF4408 domain-containing protein n=1 Tax=Ricinus communis TaxID=3988 RepID=B9RRS2_RICCO|nr:pathogen-associated molecular patterns-induced protein A70 [Ricinus communis]EEF45782.1 conserved hypothetical protein [Ricinus communis]|eukprot:XP_002516441.1 high mobility group protein DSP1 [Ricinus communis]
MFEESVTSIPSIWASMNSWFTPTVLFLFLNLMIGTIYVTSSLATQKPHQEDKQLQAHHHQIARSPSVLQRLKSINFHSYRSPEPTTVTLEKTHQFDNSSNTPFSFQQSPLEEYHQNQPFLSRSPSMLQRIKSINLYNYFSQELPNNQETHTSATTAITTTITHFTPHQDLQQEQEQLQEQQVEEKEEELEESEDKIQDQEQTLDEIYSKLKNNSKVSRSKSDTNPTSGEVPKKLSKKMKKSASAKSAFAHFEEDDDIVESRRPATVREGKSGHKMTEVDDAEVDAKADDFINRFKQQLKLQRIDSIIRYKEKVNRE